MADLPTMRMRLAFLAQFALLGAVSCGGDDGSAHVPHGIYALEDSDGCTTVLSFHPKTEEYGVGYYCELESGGVGAEIENGHYTLEFGRVYFRPDRTTCEDPELVDLAPWDVAFEVYDNGDLALIGGSFAAEYVDVPDEDSAGPRGTEINLGCWDDDEFVSYE